MAKKAPVRDVSPFLAQIDTLRATLSDRDPVTVDLLDPELLRALKLDGPKKADLLAQSRTVQRVLRIEPDAAAAAVLLSEGLGSAHRIAAMSRSRFVRELGPRLGSDGEEAAGRIYNRAILIKTRVAHLVAALRGSIASRQYRALSGYNLGDDIGEHFEALSSYQTLFGDLSYCDASGEPDILSPAAYLVDLLRVIDLAITQPNTQIPDGLSLDRRRPDLGNIELTLANTFDEVPYLQIVDAILTRTVGAGLTKAGVLQDEDIFLTLANLFYPFNLPYNRPLDRLRTYLAANSVRLSEVYGVFGGAEAPLAVSAEYLHLSAEQVDNLAPPAVAALAQTVTNNYGLKILAGKLAGMDGLGPFMAQTGLGLSDVETLLTQNLSAREIYDTTGSYSTTGRGTTLTLDQDGERVTGSFDGGGTVNAVLAANVVSGYWRQGSDAGDFQLTFSTDGASFQGQWRVGYSGDWNVTAWNGSRPASTVTAGIIPHGFFINKPLAVRQYLQIAQVVAGGDSETKIANQSLGTLDTVNRFVRLAAFLGWTYPQLDWALNSLNAPTVDASGNLTCATELGPATIVELAKIQRLLDAGMDFDLAAAMGFDVRTIGCGDGGESAAPFDVIFNNPAVLAQFPGRSIYRPTIAASASSYVNPLYTDLPIPWTLADGGGGDPAAAIVSCIPANANDLAAIAAAAFPGETQIPLTVTNLSILYRHAMLARFLNLTIPAYLGLVQAEGLGSGATLPAAFTRDPLAKMIADAGWIRSSGIGVPNLLFLMTGTPSVYATPGYQPQAIPPLLSSLGTALKPTLLAPGAFASPVVSAAESAAYTQVLVNAGYIDPLGIVLKDASAATPNLSPAGLYDPTVSAPTADQRAAVVQLLVHAAKSQLDATTQQLAAFFGAKADTLAVILPGAAAWQNLPGPVQPFLLAPLFSLDAASVQTAGLPDLAKLTKAFAKQDITLPAGASIVPQTAASWSIVDGSTIYQAVSPDLAGIAYYQGPTLLFRGSLADVTTGGALDPAKLVAAFKKAGLSLGTPTVTLAAAPLSFAVADPSSGVVYRVSQSGDAKAPLVVLQAATLPPTPPVPAAAMVLTAARMLVLAGSLNLSNVALATMMAVPSAFGFTAEAGQPVATPLAAVDSAYLFTEMVSAFADTNDGLADYLAFAQDPGSAVAADARLCQVTGWDVPQCTFLRTKMYGAEVVANTVAMVAALNDAFDLCVGGIDTYTLYALAATAQAPATQANFAAADALAAQLLESLRAGTQTAAWPTVYGRVDGPLLANQRDALVPIAISQLRQDYADITTTDSLYEYLLIDVEMSGCASISPIKEALNAAQLYLQRCRLNLERNVVIGTDDLPEIWWEWLLNYRIWQANREIFLYPENYIDPSLRRDKTKLFKGLENGLLQGDVTADRVEAEFRKYLNGLSELAKLQIVDSCRACVHDRELGKIDTLFLFARTTTQPYKFYTASRRILGNCTGAGAAEWTEWLPVSITINAEQVTAVYAFDRLLLFWSELTETKELDGTGDPNKRAAVTTLSLRYSFQNFSGDWVQPQTLVAGLPINVTGLNLYGPFSASFNNAPDAIWNKVGCLRIPATAFPAEATESERLCIYFGPLIDQFSGDGNPLPVPATYAHNPAVAQFCTAINQAAMINAQMKGLNLAGQTPLFPMVVIDATLRPAPLLFENQYLILQGDTPAAGAAPGFIAGLNGNSAVAVSATNTLVDNRIEGMGLIIPLAAAANSVRITAHSFVNDYVTSTKSGLFYAALTGATGIVDPGTGLVAQAATTVGLPLLASALDTSVGIARQVREVLLDSYFGSQVLLSDLPPGNASLIPVTNQPGAFILASGPQVFLFEAGQPQGVSPPMIDSALAVTAATAAITPAALVTRDIGSAQAARFYGVLTTAPNDVINANGQVDVNTVANGSVQILAAALQTDAGRAQEVRNILLSGSAPAVAAYGGAGFAPTDSLFTLQFNVSRLATSAIDHLSAALDSGGIAALLALPQQQLPTDAAEPFSDLGPMTTTIPVGPSAGKPAMVPPASYFGRQVDFDGPFGLYYWELFFHAPLLVAEMLHDNQQFQDAETWLQYIFNPTLPPTPLTEARFAKLGQNVMTAAQAQQYYINLTTAPNQLIDADGNVLAKALQVEPVILAAALSVPLATALEIKNLLVNQYLASPTGRYWQFQPIRNHTLESLKDQLTNCAEIAAYNDDPFDPDAIARLRIGAYEKAVVIAYIKNLLAWGDTEFSQYSWESITTARMLYSYASDLLGPRPVDLGPCARSAPTTFDIILARYSGDPDDIPQFLIEMENALPGMTVNGPLLNGAGKPFNDLGGVFAVPENDRLSALWDQVSDRLTKIRNCLNINGQPQPLPLFQPPIDPMALVRAAASGNNLLALASQLQPQVPAYRFGTMVQRAIDATATVRAFGEALLAALQSRDAEAMAALTQTNALAVMQMTILVKQKAIEDLNDQIQASQQGLASAQYRQTYYNSLISAGLNAAESAALLLMAESLVVRLGTIAFNGLSIEGYLVPNIYGLADGGMKFGDAINAGAQIASAVADIASGGASISTTVAEYQRRTADWQLQSALAGYEIAQVTSDIAAATARLAGAQQDLAVALEQIKDGQQELAFVKTKFTNEDLYGWMIGRLAPLYFQAYRLAQDLALAAQTAYQYELDRDDQFIAFAYWDDLRHGLLAGEGLTLSLTQLQKSYLDNSGRRLEIEKTISLRQSFPGGFVGFRWGFAQGVAEGGRGRLDFVLSQALFDFDFPGHYARKIKSISISIPCVIGPYQELHATLTQNSNWVATAPDPAAAAYLAQLTTAGAGTPTPPPAGTVRQNWQAAQEIAISRGVEDSGLFVIDFNDERYLPFEGTGAVSSWTFSLPPGTNAIDFDSITDVILKIRYTAKDGGDAFAEQVRQFYRQQAATFPRLMSAGFGLARSFPAQWFQAMNTAPADKKQTITFPVGAGAVLPNLQQVKLISVIVQLELADGTAVSSAAGKPFIGLQIGGQPTPAGKIAIANNFGRIDGSGFPAKFAGMPWSLQFDLADAPPALLTDGAIDPAKLTDVAVVLTYSAAPF